MRLNACIRQSGRGERGLAVAAAAGHAQPNLDDGFSNFLEQLQPDQRAQAARPALGRCRPGAARTAPPAIPDDASAIREGGRISTIALPDVADAARRGISQRAFSVFTAGLSPTCASWT
jgi:hypothetical protein